MFFLMARLMSNSQRRSIEVTRPPSGRNARISPALARVRRRAIGNHGKVYPGFRRRY